MDGGWWNADQDGVADPFPSPGFGAPPILGGGVPGFGNLPTFHNLNDNGILGGVHAGYNWQMTNWLVGAEVDVMFLNRSASSLQTVFETFSVPNFPAFNMTLTASNKWLASARARVGWLPNNNLLLYATGGAAWTSTSYTATDAGLVGGPVFLPGIGSTVSWTDNRTGYVVGGGVEWMFAPHWMVRAEYLHYGFSGSSANLPLVFAAGFGACPAGACNWAITTGRLDFDTGRVGVSYKF